MCERLTLKNMIKVIQEAGITERERVWVTYWNMKCLGFISSETWDKFYKQCKDIEMDVNTSIEMFKF